MKYGKYTIIGEAGKSKGGERLVIAECECGRRKSVYFNNLKYGKTSSCNIGKCSNRFIEEGGKVYGKRLCSVWQGMKNRCRYKTHQSHKWYYDKGIKVCKEWQRFPQFYNDMIVGYSEGLTLDRIDNSKGYCKENCRWVTRTEQIHNTNIVKLKTFNGVTLPMKEWADKLGLTYATLLHRFQRGWTTERALSTPKLCYK